MDLATSHLGLPLRNPLIASASPLTGALDSLRRLEDAGIAAVVLPSIFEEQVEAEAREVDRLTRAAEGFAEASVFFPLRSLPGPGPHRQLELIARAREALDIPVIASLNGVTEGGWTEYAQLVEEAGAHAIELNVYFPPLDASFDSLSVENWPLRAFAAVRRNAKVPIGIKLSREYSAPAALIRALDSAGAGGFVLFNRVYQADIDLASLQPLLEPQLSSRAEIHPGLMWIAVLAGTIRGSLVASTGVESASEVIKYLLVGADAVMSTSALLRHGPDHARVMLEGLQRWADARGFPSVAAMKGRLSDAINGIQAKGNRHAYTRIVQGANEGNNERRW
jgi:dihydroorotate dehydrogenase (fumarate)